MASSEVEPLIARAQVAERAGLTAEATELWDTVLRRAPDHPKALIQAGQRLMERGDLADAIDRFSRAQTADPRDANAPLHLGLAHNTKGELDLALAAFDRALAIDPYFFMALLFKASVLERMNQPRRAAGVYADAIKIAPAPDRLPPSLRQGLERARDAVRHNSESMADFLRARTEGGRAGRTPEDLRRFDECLEILAGTKQRQTHDPLLLYYPRLPAIPFFDRQHFAWLGELEAATDIIREELALVLHEQQAEFAPYIQFPSGAPVNQWVELNHSPAWSTFFLWRDGVRQDKNCGRCPNTAAVLERIPMAHQSGYGPTAMFSVLTPKTQIPPHTGSSNARLIVHLPLVLPEGCGFRVGNETREWRMGEAWVFDDTIEHQAWNNSDQTRVLLIFDVWNPLLSPAERELVEMLMIALNEYTAGDQARYSPR